MTERRIPLRSTLYYEDYLLQELPEKDEFRQSQKWVKKHFATFMKMWTKERLKIHARRKESQLEENLVRPILNWLGYEKADTTSSGPCYVVEPTLRGPMGESYEPDYTLFGGPDDFSRALAYKNQDDNLFFDFCIGVGDAKAWSVDLDKRAGRESPSQQILRYLTAAGKSYGFLTNGREWRIFRAASAEDLLRPDVYLHLDLESVVTADEKTLRSWHHKRGGSEKFDGDSEKLFWLTFFHLLFHPGSFLGDAAVFYRGKQYLERIYQEALARRIEIQEDLKERVFASLQIICRGFYNSPHWNGSRPPSLEDLDNLYSSGLLFLYRLLFVLNVEARGLLDSIQYQSLSLTRLSEDTVTKMEAQRQETLVPQYSLWKRFVDVFQVISDENTAEQFGVTHYNGGLFDPYLPGHEHLEVWTLDDESIYQLFKNLVLVEIKNRKGSRRRPIDYGALQVRHLGHIYEGLLEYKLRFADKQIYLVDGKFVDKLPPSRVVEETIFENQLYLATDKMERKTTGTYYTPDHIVDHIVMSSIEPLCRNRSWKQILALRILDPAMGSGHFLVGAIDYIAGKIHSDPDAQLPPYFQDEEVTDELTLWKRVVAEQCIYGVDKNPLAVELAKLSLWLATASKGKALSFLDSRLRCGNSLLGTFLSEVDRPAFVLKRGRWARSGKSRDQTKLTDTVTSHIKRIAREDQKLGLVSALTGTQVTRLRKQFEDKVSKPLESLRVLADIWMHQWFGDEKRKGAISRQYDTLLQSAVKNELSSRLAERDPRIYFHWELEFPHIFSFGQKPGFDAIIGNPPYEVLSSKEIGHPVDDEVRFFKESGFYEISKDRKLNLYALFIERGLHLLREGGRFSMIVPLALLGSTQPRNLRRWLLGHAGKPEVRVQTAEASLVEIHAFPQHVKRERRVFPDAEQATCVFLAVAAPVDKKEIVVQTHPGRVFGPDEVEPDRQTLREEMYAVSIESLSNLDPDECPIPYSTSQAEIELALKLPHLPGFVPLSDVGRIAQGEFNITVSKKKKVAASERADDSPRIVRGAHIARFRLQEAKQGTDLYVRLKSIRSYPSPSKLEDCQKPRIIIQEVTRADREYRRIVATCVQPPTYCGHTVNYVTDLAYHDIYAVLAIVNSSLSNWRFKLTSTSNHVSGREIGNILIPRFEDEQSQTLGDSRGIEQSVIHDTIELLQRDTDKVLRRMKRIIRKARKDQWPRELHDFFAAIGRFLCDVGEQVNEARKVFFDWLNDFLGTNSMEWKGSSRFRLLDRLDFKDFYRLCIDNKNHINKKNLDSKRVHAILKREFKDTQSSLQALISQSDELEDMVDEVLFMMMGVSKDDKEAVLTKAGNRYPSA